MQRWLVVNYRYFRVVSVQGPGSLERRFHSISVQHRYMSCELEVNICQEIFMYTDITHPSSKGIWAYNIAFITVHPVLYRTEASIKELYYSLVIWLFCIANRSRGEPFEGVGGGRWSPSPAKSPKPKFRKHIFCRHYIKSFTLFTLQPKSATDIGWWLVHYILNNKLIRTALFCVITQRVVVISYRLFGATARPIPKCQNPKEEVQFSCISRRKPEITHKKINKVEENETGRWSESWNT
jgi:hypothetical protein